MNFANLLIWASAVVISLAAVQKLELVHEAILRAQAKVIFESRTSTWGSPRLASPAELDHKEREH